MLRYSGLDAGMFWNVCRDFHCFKKVFIQDNNGENPQVFKQCYGIESIVFQT